MVAVRVLSTAADTVKEQMPKNFILVLVRARLHVYDDIIGFPKEGLTFTVFGSEDDLNFMISEPFVTCVGVVGS